ncbi:MAG: hypothetical protein PVG60_00470 [Desulfarculaceae bacterium]
MKVTLSGAVDSMYRSASKKGQARKFFWWLILILLAGIIPQAGAQVKLALEPGIYQYQDKATCELRPLEDGAWQVLFWQGSQQKVPESGFAYVGRFVPDSAQRRLSGTWQGLPGSCCPGRGRGEIQVLSSDAFRFVTFAPSLEGQAWSVLPLAEFKRVADLSHKPLGSHLAGAWRVFMWYTDLLPASAPADQVSGELSLGLQGVGASGTWQGRPGRVELSAADAGARFTYNDEAAGFEIAAALRPQAGGLSYAGTFISTLGQGEMRLVRQGLPANPPGMAAAPGNGAGGPSGTWVDSRTGSDFFEIKGSAQGFDFTAYGGSTSHPRYLSRGRAQLVAPGHFQGQAQDAEGQCCGNQGRLAFRILSPDRMEVSAFWWPQNQPDPGSPLAEPYVIERMVETKAVAPAAPAPGAGRWPVVQARLPGMLSPQAGSIKVDFIWRPQGEAQEQTLFSQGGYLRDLDLFINAQAKLAARVTTAEGNMVAVSDQDVTPKKLHEAWLIWQGPSREEGEASSSAETSPGQVELILDGEPAASLSLTQPWNGSNSPYLVGARRWPGREFQGDIRSVGLWRSAQDPANPSPPDLTITPPPPGQAPETAPAEEGPSSLPLIRLWNVQSLVHAYAAGAEQAERLRPLGFTPQGPIGKILTRPGEDTKELWAFRHRSQGYMVLATTPQAPPGCDTVARLGYVWSQARPEAVPLFELKAIWPEPLRGGQGEDRLYTSSLETSARAQGVGYKKPAQICYVMPDKEPEFQPPLHYTWPGSWQGEGWGRFFISRHQNEIFMFWYYSRLDGPHYFGRYRLSQDGSKAEGIAVGRTGKRATYYRHKLEFVSNSPQGPRVKLTSWRLAAPLDDGRIVLFKKPQSATTYLRKVSQTIPTQEAAILEPAAGPAGKFPDRLMNQALNQARQGGRLLER